MHGQLGYDTRPHARLPPNFTRHRCIDDLTTERYFESQATWVINVLGLFLTYCTWVLVQPGTGRRPVDWCRNLMSVLNVVIFNTILLLFISGNLVTLR